MENSVKHPKVFISYSWSSEEHKNAIRQLAERLLNDGVDVVLDQWDLKEGDDKNAFMEQMVTDPSVSHVLVFSDKVYSKKANERHPGGVGTECQIISNEIYNKVTQQKFIPIILEFDDQGEPCLPVFFKSRIGIDFRSSEQINANWETLLRAIIDKPLYQKPAIGTLPSYITADEARPSLPTLGKFEALKHAIREGRPNVPLLRRDFFDAAFDYAENLHPLSQATEGNETSTILAVYSALLPLRNQMVEWLTLDLIVQTDAVLTKEIIRVFEQFRKLKQVRPNTTDTDAHAGGRRIFLYELFLYFSATIIQEERLNLLRQVLDKKYLKEGDWSPDFQSFTIFSFPLDAFEKLTSQADGQKQKIASLLKNNAHFKKVPYLDLVQADMVLFIISGIEMHVENYWWCPHLITRGHTWRDMPFIQNAFHTDGYNKLSLLLGVKDKITMQATVDKLLEIVPWSSAFHHLLQDLKDDGLFEKLGSR